MKNFIVFLCLLGVAMYWSNGSAYAQKSGSSQGSSLNHGHSQDSTPDKAKVHEAKADWETKFNERFQNDAAFHAKIQSLLPPNTDLKTAESGFKNHGQFIAALHVSHNLGIPFDQLKAKMTGVTTTASGQTVTSPKESLGKAIHELRPDLSQNAANDEAKKAEKQASDTDKPKTT